jgi:adenosylcobinamide kinase / adenosylcobinamide-phosphate guanylyltransferase
VARTILITGGSRSGKSDYALQLAEELPEPWVFVATCPITDDEMADRIRKHRDRRSSKWITIEEPVLLSKAVGEQSNAGVILIDCVTLWINNLLYNAEKQNKTISEADIERLCGELAASCRVVQSTVIIVTNEIGSGIVPENKSTRLYRDLVGKANQVIASYADEVYFVACGLPLALKRGSYETT